MYVCVCVCECECACKCVLSDSDRTGNIMCNKTSFSDLHACVYVYLMHEITEVEVQRAY